MTLEIDVNADIFLSGCDLCYMLHTNFFLDYILMILFCQVVLLEALGEGAQFSNLSASPFPLYIPFFMLIFDSFLYLVIAVYLDQVVPGM